MENKHNFKKYDIVLVRDEDYQDFSLRVFSHVDGNNYHAFKGYSYSGDTLSWKQCKPFEKPQPAPQEAPKPDTTPFYAVGDEVECLIHGKGRVDVILDNNEFLVMVCFDDGSIGWYTYDGRLYTSKTQTLYPAGKCPTLPPIERPEPKKQAFPESIKDLPICSYCWVDSEGHIIAQLSPDFTGLPTHEAAVSQRAANQLACLIDHLNSKHEVELGVWVVDSKLTANSVAFVHQGSVVPHFLRFKHYDDAAKSAKVHAKLWREYYTGKE